MSVWFEGVRTIDVGMDRVRRDVEDIGDQFLGVIRRMPGLTSVELVDEGGDAVTIRTNEGTMKRTNIVKRATTDVVAVEFDEEYRARSRLTTTAHFVHEFTPSGEGVAHRLVISDVDAPGLLGFFYRRFGGARTGNAFLRAYEAHLSRPPS